MLVCSYYFLTTQWQSGKFESATSLKKHLASFGFMWAPSCARMASVCSCFLEMSSLRTSQASATGAMGSASPIVAAPSAAIHSRSVPVFRAEPLPAPRPYPNNAIRINTTIQYNTYYTLYSSSSPVLCFPELRCVVVVVVIPRSPFFTV